jgi:iron complex transport system substrate-binding protein
MSMSAALPPGVPLFDEDGALSREFLLHRGYCCENGCRNCPYGYRKAALPCPAAGDSEFTGSGMPARRIVSLCPSNTEILAALGLLSRVVGVDDWSDWPPEVRDLPRVGPDLSIRIDRVEALQPDLVVASLSVPGMEKNVARLRERGLPHVVLDPHSLGDIWENIRRVGELTGTFERAEQVIGRLHARIQQVRRRVAGVPRRPRLYWEWWPKPLFAPGGRNWLTPVSELAGCVNITGEVDAAAVRPTWEEVVAADPELILLAWTGVPIPKVRPDVVLRRPGWERITAVREGRIHIMEEGLFCRPSPRLVDGLERLVDLAHPEL